MTQDLICKKCGTRLDLAAKDLKQAHKPDGIVYTCQHYRERLEVQKSPAKSAKK